MEMVLIIAVAALAFGWTFSIAHTLDLRDQVKSLKKDLEIHKKALEEAQTEVVRAKDDKGRFIKDDPSTPQNEAYTTVPKKPGRKPKRSPGSKAKTA